MKMNSILLKKIASALTRDDKEEDKTCFFAEDELTPEDINVEVAGLGHLSFPLAISCLENLVSISSKAKFGLRDQTLLDENVRNTNEIARDKLCVTINQTSLTRVLNKMSVTLGLSENSVLTPHLHNMLIYSRGQFFDMHQDTEKMDNMIATLVIVLPSSHIGGDLVIHHGEKKHVFSSENINATSVKCLGFYADCKHKIEKVKHGYRVALTYNLVLKTNEITSNEITNRKLRNAIQEYFNKESCEEPQKLIYFLNHNYTEHGLRWDMLKGSDRTNAIEIFTVAESLGLVSNLALVKIQESFSTCGDYYDKDPDTEELLDTSTTLSYWLNSTNKQLPFDEWSVKDDNICWTKETECFQPYKSEYEGYQGNWGGNKDYWYRRAAIVLWAESSQIPINFLLNNHNAIKDLLELSKIPGNEKQILEVIDKAGKYLYKSCKDNEEVFFMLANIALYLHDNDVAFAILSHFTWTILSVSTAELLAKLQIQYGIGWCSNILDKWENNYGNNCNIDKIDFFIKMFLHYEGAVQIAELLLDKQSIEKDEYIYCAYIALEVRLPERLQKLQQIFKGCAAIENVSILHKVIERIVVSPRKYPIIKLVDLYLSLKEEVSSEYFTNFKPLKTYLVNAVDSELALGEHSDDNWSIIVQLSCTCEYCNIAKSFLNSKTEVTKRWPIREKLRNHVSNRLMGLKLPITISVERSGSPHKLIIKKEESMHQMAHKRFQELKCCHEKLHA